MGAPQGSLLLQVTHRNSPRGSRAVGALGGPPRGTGAPRRGPPAPCTVAAGASNSGASSSKGNISRLSQGRRAGRRAPGGPPSFPAGGPLWGPPGTPSPEGPPAGAPEGALSGEPPSGLLQRSCCVGGPPLGGPQDLFEGPQGPPKGGEGPPVQSGAVGDRKEGSGGSCCCCCCCDEQTSEGRNAAAPRATQNLRSEPPRGPIKGRGPQGSVGGRGPP